MSLDLLVLMRVCLRWNQVEKAQHEPHWPWFLIGVTVPCGPVNRLGGRRNVELLDVENLVDVVLQRRGASQPQKRLVSTSTKPQHRVFLGCLEALVAGHHRGLDLECRPRSPPQSVVLGLLDGLLGGQCRTATAAATAGKVIAERSIGHENACSGMPWCVCDFKRTDRITATPRGPWPFGDLMGRILCRHPRF